MIPSETELKKKGKRLMVVGWGFLAFIVGSNVFYFLCRDHGMAFLAGIGLGVGTYVMMISQALVAPELTQPPAKLYQLTPIYVLAEIKQALATQYFGDRKWHLDEANQDKLTMAYSFKHAKEQQMNEQGAKPQKQEAIVTLLVKVDRVSEGSSVETVFSVVHGTMDFDIQDIMKQTTGLIDAVLKALEAQRQGQV